MPSPAISRMLSTSVRQAEIMRRRVEWGTVIGKPLFRIMSVMSVCGMRWVADRAGRWRRVVADVDELLGRFSIGLKVRTFFTRLDVPMTYSDVSAMFELMRRVMGLCSISLFATIEKGLAATSPVRILLIASREMVRERCMVIDVTRTGRELPLIRSKMSVVHEAPRCDNRPAD